MTQISLEELQNLKNLEDKLITASIQYMFRDAASSSTHFKKDFVEQTIVNPLKSMFGQLGSAKFNVKLLAVNDNRYTADIQIEASQFFEFWAAFILNKAQGNIIYKVKLISMQIANNEEFEESEVMEQ